MNEPLNILILSCGTRNKIVQYFKKAVAGQGKVFASDCSELAPALYEADEHFLVPRVDEPGYIDIILTICRDHQIKGVLSLIDPELSLLAEHFERFRAIGTTPIISPLAVVEKSFDKYSFYQSLMEIGLRTVKSYIDKEEFYRDLEAGQISFPVFVKPVRGSASINISRVNDREELELLFRRYDDLMIQELMEGTEYGIDAYIDLITGEPVTIFCKKKLKMRAGETDKSVSVKDDRLFGLIADFVKTYGYRGIIDIDVFMVNDEYYISEVNPRFGGGYPHAHECGINVPEMILNNLKGIPNEDQVGNYKVGTSMMKYNEIMMLGL